MDVDIKEEVDVQETDEELLLEYRRTGDPKPFSQLVSRYEHMLFAYLHRFLGNATLAEDIFQLTFLQVHLKCNGFEKGRRVRPWLYKIATNQAIDAVRRNRRRQHLRLDIGYRRDKVRQPTILETLADDEPTPVTRLEQNETTQWVRRAVDGLPEHLRGPVVLVYFQGLKYREAAAVLSVPVGTLKSRMHSALEKMKEFSPRTCAHSESLLAT